MLRAVIRITAAALVALLPGSCALYRPLPAEQPPEAPPPSAVELQQARAIMARANAVRAQHSAGPLREVSQLMRAAQDYAVELAALQRLSHDSPTRGRMTMTQRIAAAGGSWRSAAENLAATSGVADLPGTIIDMWLRSPGHRTNLLEPKYTTTGVGVARDRRGAWYVVQLYVLPPPRQ